MGKEMSSGFSSHIRKNLTYLCDLLGYALEQGS